MYHPSGTLNDPHAVADGAAGDTVTTGPGIINGRTYAYMYHPCIILRKSQLYRLLAAVLHIELVENEVVVEERSPDSAQTPSVFVTCAQLAG